MNCTRKIILKMLVFVLSLGSLIFPGGIMDRKVYAADNWWETGTTNVYTIYPYWSDYTSKYGTPTLQSVTNQLDTYKSQGFNAILFQPLNDGDPSIWGGLASLKLMDVKPDIGSLTDYDNLISAAHSKGMKIILFYNLGFCSVNAPFFEKACDDYKNGVSSAERNWFVFSNSSANPPPGFGWAWSARAGAYYLYKWDVNAPSYNWNHPDWRNKVVEVIRFWMDRGTDGMAFDAPLAYYGITQSYINTYITDVLNSYPNAIGYCEGVGSDLNLITNHHFMAVEDYEFSGQWERPTKLANAILNQNPSALEGILNAYRDRVVNAGGILWSPPEWGRLGGAPVLTPAQRALEIATICSVGALCDWHDTQDNAVYDFWTAWAAADRQKVFNIMKASRDNSALGPGGTRLKLNTNNDNAYYAFKRTSKDGTKAALVILNFRNSQQTITVDLTGSGIGPQTPIDLINGGSAAPINSSSYTVTLPAYGYKFLGLPLAQGSGGVLNGSSAHTQSSINLSSQGTDDWAHWGLNTVGDFNHKSGVTQKISNYIKIGTGTVQRFANNNIYYTWTGGTPTSSATNTNTGIYVTGNGNGFRITVPADTTQKTLKLYVGGYQAYCCVHAYLSDGSSPDYIDLFDSSATVNKEYTLSYKAGSAGNTLTVDVTVQTAHEVFGNVTLQAAALSTGD